MKRRRGSRAPMFFRMLVRAAMLRKRTAISALLAITLAAAAATAMLNLFVDVHTKLRKEFRGFGANIVVEAANGGFDAADLQRIETAVANRGLAVPFSYAVARTSNGEAVVVAGTDFDLVRTLNPWWAVSAWPNHPGEALFGVRAAQAIAHDNTPITLAYKSRSISLIPAGTVRTGAGEDNRIYISLPDFESWSGLQPSVVEVAAYGPATDISSVLATLAKAVPTASVHPVRRVTEGEANVLGKTRSTLLWSSIFIIVTAALCVLATLTGWLFDRRRDFAIMKAIGASDRLIAFFVLGEAVVLACAGALLGYAGGVGIAVWIGRTNFHAPVVPRIDVLPLVLAGCVAITFLATLLPLRLLRQIQPAMILRGE